MHGPGSFGLPDHPERLPRTGGPPGAPGRHVDPGAFRPALTEAPGHGDRPEGDWPPRDPVTMSGIPVPASMDGLGDGRTGFPVRDRPGRPRFPGSRTGGPAPDRRRSGRFARGWPGSGRSRPCPRLFGERLRDRGHGPARLTKSHTCTSSHSRLRFPGASRTWMARFSLPGPRRTFFVPGGRGSGCGPTRCPGSMTNVRMSGA